MRIPPSYRAGHARLRGCTAARLRGCTAARRAPHAAWQLATWWHAANPMARTRGEPPRRHAGPLPMECDYGKKLNGRRPADSPRLPSYNEPETSATERQRGGKHAYTQEKPARNAPEMRACRAMNAMGSLSRSRRAAPARGKVDSPLFAVHAHELAASGAGAGSSRPDALGAGTGACGSDASGAGAG